MGDDRFHLTAEQERVLVSLLDAVVPPSPDGGLPGAGAVGLVAHVVRTVERMPMLRPILEYGLSAIDELARQRGAGGFAALPAEERSALVKEFTAGDQVFLPAFLFLAYSGYYQTARVVEALGLEARPPHPEGYPMGADDWDLLDPVRRRGKVFRTP